MRKNLTVLLAALLIGGTAFGQAISDRNVVPVAVNLNQVLRMTITNGGNIEFVFSTIDHYRSGISGAAGVDADAMYLTEFTVASSTSWELTYGAEQGTFIGTDNTGNALLLDNVGFSIESNGAHNIGAAAGTDELLCAPTTGTVGYVADLDAYPVPLLTHNPAGDSNAGDEDDNSFTMTWRCGTAEDDMNSDVLIEQSITPDRYVANVLFELTSL